MPVVQSKARCQYQRQPSDCKPLCSAPAEFVGEMDLVLSPVIYWAVEHGTSVFKELRKQVYLIRNRGK